MGKKLLTYEAHRCMTLSSMALAWVHYIHSISKDISLDKTVNPKTYKSVTDIESNKLSSIVKKKSNHPPTPPSKYQN